MPTLYVLSKNMKIVKNKKNKLKIVIFTAVKKSLGRVFVMAYSTE